MNLKTAVVSSGRYRSPSSPALLSLGDGRKLPLLLGEGWGEGKAAHDMTLLHDCFVQQRFVE